MGTVDPRETCLLPENVARIMASPYPQDGLVTEAEELRRIVRESTLPAIKVWVHRSLEADANRLWEES